MVNAASMEVKPKSETPDSVKADIPTPVKEAVPSIDKEAIRAKSEGSVEPHAEIWATLLKTKQPLSELTRSHTGPSSPPLSHEQHTLSNHNSNSNPLHASAYEQCKSLRSTATPTTKEGTLLCIMCPAPSAFACDGCSAVHYCSKACRNLDASAHRILCNKWPQFDKQQRPGETFHRAVYLPDGPDHDNVQFVWLRFWTNKTQDDVDYQVPILGSYFTGTTEDERQNDIVIQDYLLCRPLERHLRVISLVDQSDRVPKNQCAADLINSRFSHEWRGPILAFGDAFEEDNSVPLGVYDLEFADYRHVLDHLTTHRSTALASDMRYFGRTIRGVKINCDGDRNKNVSNDLFDDSVPRFEDVRVPISHRLFASKTLSIPKKMGIPIQWAPYPRRLKSEATFKAAVKSIRCRDSQNHAFRELAAEWLIASQPRNLPSPAESNDNDAAKTKYSGSVILARKDEKPLSAQHVEALWRYNKFILEPIMTRVSSIDGNHDSSEVDRKMTEEEFSTYYYHFQTFLANGDARSQWHPSPSPYESKKRTGSLKRMRCGSVLPVKKMRYEWCSDGDAMDDSQGRD
jgi:hypothetical protein